MTVNISNQIIIDELKKRHIKYDWFCMAPQMLRVYLPGRPEGVVMTPLLSEFTNSIGEVIAKKKLISYKVAADNKVMQPAYIRYSDMKQAKEFLSKYKKVVVKPEDLAHGNGVKVDIADEDELEGYLLKLGKTTKRIIIQEQVEGYDLRLLFIGEKYVSTVVRFPAEVTADGKHMIEELIENENKKHYRGVGYREQLNVIDVEKAVEYLGNTMKEVPARDKKIRVIGVANVGAGGIARDISDEVHPGIIKIATKVKELMKTTHAGVDFMIQDYLMEPSASNPLYFIEINSRPYLGFHQKPNIGKGKDVAKLYVEWLLERSANN